MVVLLVMACPTRNALSGFAPVLPCIVGRGLVFADYFSKGLSDKSLHRFFDGSAFFLVGKLQRRLEAIVDLVVNVYRYFLNHATLNPCNHSIDIISTFE